MKSACHTKYKRNNIIINNIWVSIIPLKSNHSMMNKIMFILLLLASNTILYSQENYSDQLSLDSIFEPKLTGESYSAKAGMIGSQFFNDDWVESDILLTTGEKVFNKLLKYNGYSDEVVWLVPENFKQVKLDKYAIDEFVLKNYRGKSILFKRINVKQMFLSDSTDIFAEVLIESKLSLYVFRKIGVAGTVNKSGKEGVYSFDELEPAPVYYLKLTNSSFFTLQRLKRRALLNIFPEQKTAIRKLLRQNHQQLKTESDLIEVVNLLNKSIFN